MINHTNVCDVLEQTIEIGLGEDYQVKDYLEAVYVQKETLHVLIWLIIPEEYRAHYLNRFTNSQKEILERVADSGVVESIKELMEKEDIDLPNLYQMMLNIDLIIKNGKIKIASSKASRDKYGAYYTPSDLAKYMVSLTIDEEGNRHIDAIDFSCGCGVFLVEFAKHYLSIFGETVENRNWLAGHLHGVDVDLIALLITAYEVAKVINMVPQKLTLGNPLLISDASDYSKRKELFFKNLIYSTDMGLPNSFFKQKFDVILGNPPWEKIRFEERKFFSASKPEIASLSLKSARAVEIEKLKDSDPALYSYYYEMMDSYKCVKQLIKKHPLLTYSLRGELNTYAVFTELGYSMLKDDGCCSLLVKASLLKMQAHSTLIQYFYKNDAISKIDLFINRKRIFAIDSREEFAVLTLARNKDLSSFVFKADLDSVDSLKANEGMKLSYKDMYNINPNSGLFPNICNETELNFLIHLHKVKPRFEAIYSNVKFGRLVHLTNHSEYMHKMPNESYTPVYEGKFIEMYDGRFAGFQNVPTFKKYVGKATACRIEEVHQGEKDIPESRYFIENVFWNELSKNYSYDYMLAWRSLTSPTNRRTMISTLLPFMPTSQSIQFLVGDAQTLIVVNALFNSIIFDYLVRLQMPGIDLTQTVVKNIPVPSQNDWELEFNGKTIRDCVIERVVKLYANESRLKALFGNSDKIHQDKKEIIAEIDCLIAKAYGLKSYELIRIARTFPSYYQEEEIELYFKF